MIIRKQIPRYTHRVSVSNGYLIVLGGEARQMSLRVISGQTVAGHFPTLSAIVSQLNRSTQHFIFEGKDRL
jgi:Tfp pilus assembly pilus retraction ATPase PilT